METEIGFIVMISPHILIVEISRLGLKRTFKHTEIKFRGKPAPKNLLAKDTEVNCYVKNNEIVDAWIDAKLEITAAFLKIKSFSKDTHDLTLSDDQYITFDISIKNLIGHEHRSIQPSNIDSYISNFTVMFFNREVPIEARILKETLTNTYFLDELNKGPGQINTEYIAINDDKMITYKIFKNYVYFKGFRELFDPSLVKKYLGVEVKVSIKNSSIYAEVQVENEIAEKNRYSDQIKLQVHDFQVDLKPIHGERFYTESHELFQKFADYLDDSSALLLSLLEVSFRFNHWPGRELLKNDLNMQIMRNASRFTDCIGRIFEVQRTNQPGTIERLYQLFRENIKLLKNSSQVMFPKPINFNYVSEYFKVCIFVLNEGSGEWINYYPIRFNNESFPISYFKKGRNITLLYSKAMMEYDGYNCQSLNYQEPIQTDLMFCPVEQVNVSQIFRKILKIKEKISATDEEAFEIYHELVREVRALSIQSNEPVETTELYNNLVMFDWNYETKKRKCHCGSDFITKYQCHDHYLCDSCAFISLRIGVCITCNSKFDVSVSIGNLICSNCGYSGEDKYFFGFSCKCIICTGCLSYILNNQYKLCFKSHKLNELDIRKGISYLKILY